MLRPQINASDVAHHRVQMKLAEVTVQGSRFADLGPEHWIRGIERASLSTASGGASSGDKVSLEAVG